MYIPVNPVFFVQDSSITISHNAFCVESGSLQVRSRILLGRSAGHARIWGPAPPCIYFNADEAKCRGRANFLIESLAGVRMTFMLALLLPSLFFLFQIGQCSCSLVGGRRQRALVLRRQELCSTRCCKSPSLFFIQ